MNCKTEWCGIFLLPTDSRYGSSPDVLGHLGILLELKTRGEEFFVLWNRLKSSHITLFSASCKCYALVLSSVFCNLTILNQRLQKFFIIEYNNTLMTIIKEIADCMFDEKTCPTGLIKKLSNYKLLPNKFELPHELPNAVGLITLGN